MRIEDLCNYSLEVKDTSEVNEGSSAPMLTTNNWAYIFRWPIIFCFMNFYSALTNCTTKLTRYYRLVIIKTEILWTNCLGLKKVYPSYISHSKKFLQNLFFRKYCISKFLICWLMWEGQQVTTITFFYQIHPFPM
jgi:hypothetical protein